MKQVERPAVEGVAAVRAGRRLGFAVFGDPTAEETIIWLHGTPGARRQIPLDARRYAAEAGVRVIGIDRPGIGWSDPCVYANVLEFTEDLALVVDHLGVGAMHVVGLSGGGPYTLAAGVALGDRVTSLGVIGGVAPTVGPDAVPGGAVALARPFAPLIRTAKVPLGALLGGLMKTFLPLGPAVLELYAAVQPAGDRRLLRDPDFKAMFIDDLTNGAREQFSAVLSDILVFTRDWGFRLAGVSQPVRWWHGPSDHIVPFRHGEHVVGRLPDADLIPLEGEAHLGGLNLASDIIGGLVPGREVIEQVVEAGEA